MLFNKILFTVLVAAFISSACFAEYFSMNATYKVCFSPGNNCALEVIKSIAAAKQQILVQAYSFTDTNIANALVIAKKRGVDIKVILDKSQIKTQHGQNKFLAKKGIEILIDHKPTLAHNKVIIIDGVTVLGGSYNYTANAARHNAENLLIINDANFAKLYGKNWQIRERESMAISNYLLSMTKK